MTLEIRETDIIASMGRDNPWWEMTEGEWRSGYTKRRAFFKGFAKISLSWKVNRSVILMGPRRVGKTVMLMQLIEQALQKGIKPESIFFVSIDTPLYSGRSLQALVSLFEKASSHEKNGQRLIIFDEIQYLKDWEVHLKVLTDQLPNTKFIASGSAAAALKRASQESGAGRFTDYLLPPLNFAEYLHFSGEEQKLNLSNPCTDDISSLNMSLLDYLNFGGYPEAVINDEVRRNVTQYLGRDIINKILLSDLPSLYGIQDIQELKRLFTTIAYNSGNEFSLESLSTNSGVAKNTISKYLEYLEAAFLIVRVRRVDDTGRTFQRAHQFKAYLTNPSMRSALFAPLTLESDAIGAMVETAIFSQWFNVGGNERIFYARWKDGRTDREVDFVHVDAATLKPSWALETKWTDRHAHELDSLAIFAQKNNLVEQGKVEATTKTISNACTTRGIDIPRTPSALYCYRIAKRASAEESLVNPSI